MRYSAMTFPELVQFAKEKRDYLEAKILLGETTPSDRMCLDAMLRAMYEAGILEGRRQLSASANEGWPYENHGPGQDAGDHESR